MKFTVPLTAIKDPTKSTELTYVQKSIDKAQRRLKNRIVLEPEISLSDFKCKAVIDWVDVILRVKRDTQFQWIKKEIDDATGQNVHIEVLNERAGRVSSEFEVRIQDADLRIVQRAVDAVEAKFGLNGDPVVQAIEISVDFTPKSPSQQLRSKLVGVMIRHFMPTRDIISYRRDRPRYSWGRRSDGNTRAVLPWPKDPCVMDQSLVCIDSDLPAHIDATFYLGEDGSDCSWRIMDKILDRQNPSDGSRAVLAEADRRVRIEVTLRGQYIGKLGLERLDDLKRYSFTKMQGDFFRFMLPTFEDTSRMMSGTSRAVWTHFERLRRMKFLNTGVLGLNAYDDARKRIVRPVRNMVRRDLKKRGHTLSLKPRVGDGIAGTGVAYKDLNKRVEAALRELRDRMLR
ncbi:hypothetical protein [Phyllobacterium bourgognense]|uniref:Uncharacterized protein n=1 Tax=Phyllobacterium bourgognense TaxID=314236 RepID=A0A368Z6L6_9HYPH|nr:hypothetical protein [Phyllobacterium bourgognense]RCW87589.1 hypothetical protein C7476_101355 [Phyllobacterium bourgognense]